MNYEDVSFPGLKWQLKERQHKSRLDHKRHDIIVRDCFYAGIDQIWKNRDERNIYIADHRKGFCKVRDVELGNPVFIGSDQSCYIMFQPDKPVWIDFGYFSFPRGYVSREVAGEKCLVKVLRNGVEISKDHDISEGYDDEGCRFIRCKGWNDKTDVSITDPEHNDLITVVFGDRLEMNFRLICDPRFYLE